MQSSPSVPKAFFLAARPKTWIASISPVLIGTMLAPRIDGPIFALTLLFALLIQIGTNYANDAFDFLKGADTAERKGPARATQQGWISAPLMLRAAAAIFVSAIFAAIPLMNIAGLWSIFAVIVCVALGVFYTGGPKPLGYFGWGETLVFIFFGPVAVCGAYYLQTLSMTPFIFVASLAPGLLSCSLIVANNLRDFETDIKANKQTLIVRFGKTFGRWEYVSCILLAALVPITLIAFFGAPLKVAVATVIFPLSFPLLKRALTDTDFIPLLQGSGLLLWIYTLLFTLLSL